MTSSLPNLNRLADTEVEERIEPDVEGKRTDPLEVQAPSNELEDAKANDGEAGTAHDEKGLDNENDTSENQDENEETGGYEREGEEGEEEEEEEEEQFNVMAFARALDMLGYSLSAVTSSEMDDLHQGLISDTADRSEEGDNAQD